MTTIGYIVIAAVALAALAVVFWDRRQTRRILKSLNEMLDGAIQGEFRERSFDESLLSAVETRLAHYLSASVVSAKNLQKEKDNIKTLIADISHQTKTPIANILLYTHLLAEHPLPEDSRTCVTALESQAEKLQSLIESLVKTSRLETGILALHPQAGPLAPMLEESVAQFASRAAEKGVTLTLVPVPADATAVFDAKWTGEAVCNLLDNAIKYTPAGGSVIVQAASYELFCRINVADTGPGIPEEEQAKIFQRFYRASTAHQTEGVGIGLYLARQIAQSQSGYIKVFSKPGRGAKFSLYLPRN